MSLNLINKKIERKKNKRGKGEMAKGPKRDINMCVL